MRAIALLLLPLGLLLAQNLPLRFEGNKALGERELYESMGLELPYFYQFWKKEPKVGRGAVALMADSLKSYYRSRGYFHAQITTEIDEEEARIRIEENRPVRIEDISTISLLDLSEVIGFEKGEVFDAERFGETKSAVRARYNEAGYCNATLDAKAWIDIEEDRAYLLYEVDPQRACRFGTVQVESPEHVEPWIIESLLEIEEDAPYSAEAVRRSYTMLNAQEGLSSVRIDTKNRKEHIVPVTVSAEESPSPVRTRFGLGYSSDERFVVQAGVRHTNLYGNLKTLGLDARYSDIRQSVKAHYSMPLRSVYRLGAEAGFKEEQFAGYNDQSVYAKGFLQQRYGEGGFEEALIFDRIRTYASEDETRFPEDILFVVSPALSWHHDRRDRLLEPTKGYFVNYEIMGASRSAFCDATYLKNTLSGGYLYSIDESVIGLRAKLGSLRLYDGRLPASYRFYAGGMSSNRAYRYRMLGPQNSDGDPIGFESVVEATAEYRFPIAGEFRGVLFTDVTFIGADYAPDTSEGYHALGAGVRYKTPIGPIAFDAGFDVEEPSQYAIHFHIGELF